VAEVPADLTINSRVLVKALEGEDLLPGGGNYVSLVQAL